MKPILILKFPYSSQYGGGEQHTLQLFAALAKQHTQFYFAGSCLVLLNAFRQRGWPALRWWAGKEPVAAWSAALFPFSSIVALPGLIALAAYYRCFRGVRTLYCLSFTEKVLLTPFARALGMKVLWVEHVASTRRWLRLNPFRPLFVWWSRMAIVISISDNVAESLTELGVQARSIRVIYNGIDLAPYRELHRTTSHWMRTFILGTVVRLEPNKGIHYLLRAFHTLFVSLPHARLVVVGDGPERKQLEWLSRRLDVGHAVQFVGFQQPEKIPHWLQSFDCFVLPSVERESFGISLVQAMAAGCPVIASRIGGIPEVVHDGETGLLIDPKSSEQIVRAVLTIYQHPDMAMERARKAYAMVEKKFTLGQMVENIQRYFV